MDAADIDALAAAQKIPRRQGRPMGARNYGSISIIAKTMKERGLSWVSEFIDAYQMYKKQLSARVDNPELPSPNPELLYFWMEMMPYITIKMIERQIRRGERIKRKPKISKHAIEQLVKAEGRTAK